MCNFPNNNRPGKTLNNKGSLNNTASPEDITDPINAVQSKYYDTDELQTIKISNKDKSLALFHINACSLNKNFNELEHLVSCKNRNFDAIATSENRK